VKPAYSTILSAFLVLLTSASYAVPPPARLTLYDQERLLSGDGSRGPFRFHDTSIIEGSESVWVSDTLQVRDVDYQIDPEAATLTVFQSVRRAAAFQRQGWPAISQRA
jgi:hypothetical protein